MAQHTPTALVTGGAKRIGAHLARHLAARGYDLVLHYHTSKSEAEALAAELPVKVTLAQADLTKPETLEDFWKGLPPVSLLVHNASLFRRDTIDTMSADTLREHLAIHIETPLLLSQGFLAQLPRDVSGTILMLGDAAMGWSVAPQFFSYAMSKHAWASMIDLLAAAVAPRARANVIAPGPTLPFSESDAVAFPKLAQRAPLGRLCTPEDIIAALDYLLASPGVTGQVLSLANGMDLGTFRHSPSA